MKNKNIITCVVAVDQNFAIGKTNTIPWKLPGDMQLFKHITMGENVLMGSNTYRSLPPSKLPGRNIFVFSKQMPMDPSKYALIKTFKAIEEIPNVHICGGVKLYDRFIPKCDILYITRVNAIVKGADAHIKPINFDRFYLMSEYPFMRTDTENEHQFVMQKWVSKAYYNAFLQGQPRLGESETQYFEELE